MRAKRTVLIAALTIALASIITIALGQSAPPLINYQGRLMNASGQPLNGDTVDLTFTFYGSETGGSVFLTVLQEDVLVNEGLYNVLIGSGTVTPGTESGLTEVFKNHTDVWMGVKVTNQSIIYWTFS